SSPSDVSVPGANHLEAEAEVEAVDVDVEVEAALVVDEIVESVADVDASRQTVELHQTEHRPIEVRETNGAARAQPERIGDPDRNLGADGRLRDPIVALDGADRKSVVE